MFFSFSFFQNKIGEGGMHGLCAKMSKKEKMLYKTNPDDRLTESR